MIKSVSNSKEEILQSIVELYCPNGIQCDLTYGNGGFYKNGIKEPQYCFDIQPLKPHVIQASSISIPQLDCNSVESVMFDPPFLTYIKQGREHNSIMAKRFSGYYHYEELESHYKCTLQETVRILKEDGIMIFKCQDIIHNHKMHCTHNNVINWANDSMVHDFKDKWNLVLKDLFILAATHRIPIASNKKQEHARIFHSYFLVFEKKKMKKEKIISDTTCKD